MKKKGNWETALQKFLKKWESKKEVVGALVCGSYVTGNPSEHSDIDLHLILNAKTSWRERGDEIIDGFLISYFANPARQHKFYNASDYKSRKTVNAHMFASGRILFDKTGELKKLVSEAKKHLTKKFPKQNATEIKLAKYNLWDTRDNLEEVFESNSDDFFFVFHNNLSELFETYAKFLQFHSIPPNKLKRFLTNEKDKQKYMIANFPDQKFVKMFTGLLKTQNKSQMMKAYQKLTDHVFVQMGGFNINGWKLRTPANS